MPFHKTEKHVDARSQQFENLGPYVTCDTAKRLKRGHKPGAKDSKTSKETKSKGNTNADVIKNLKAVQRSVSQLSKQQTAADDDATNTTEATADVDFEGNSPSKVKRYGHPTTNRTNATLTRQLKKLEKAVEKAGK